MKAHMRASAAPIPVPYWGRPSAAISIMTAVATNAKWSPRVPCVVNLIWSTAWRSLAVMAPICTVLSHGKWPMEVSALSEAFVSPATAMLPVLPTKCPVNVPN